MCHRGSRGLLPSLFRLGVCLVKSFGNELIERSPEPCGGERFAFLRSPADLLSQLHNHASF